ncbi:MAG: EamA family transporter [Desulfuromonadales bacterium]|nr:MAG: EamA family transporter [Desulfuromonadales bacterium]
MGEGAETTGRGAGGVWLILAAAVLWGTTGTSQALAPVGASPATVGALRLAVGGLALLVVAVVRGGLRGGGRWPLVATACAGIFIAAYQVTFFAAVARTGVAVGTMVGIGSSPVFAGILGYLVRGERPGLRWAAATLLAVAGCSLLLVAGGGISVNPVGILLALGASASYAAYTLAIKVLLDGRSPDAVVAVAFCLGALILAPLLVGANLSWVMDPRGFLVTMHLGLIATALSYQLFARGLRTVPVATAVTLSLAEPLTAAILGVAVVGERLTPLALCGIALLFGGLALLAVRRKPAGSS